MRRLSVVVLFAVYVAALAGCSSSGDQETTAARSTHPSSSGPLSGTPADAGSAADALLVQLRQLDDGQYARLYRQLHPAQQAKVSEAQFNACYQATPLPGVGKAKVTDTYRDRVQVPGGPEVGAVALTAHFDDTNGTFHEVKVGGTWRWFMDAQRFEDARSGRC